MSFQIVGRPAQPLLQLYLRRPSQQCAGPRGVTQQQAHLALFRPPPLIDAYDPGIAANYFDAALCELAYAHRLALTKMNCFALNVRSLRRQEKCADSIFDI